MSDDEQEARDGPRPPLDPPPALQWAFPPPGTATSASDNSNPASQNTRADPQVAGPATAFVVDRSTPHPQADANLDTTSPPAPLIDTFRGLGQATVRGIDERTGGTFVRQRHVLSDQEQQAEDAGRFKARRRLDRIVQAAWPLVVVLAFFLVILSMVLLALLLLAAVPEAWSAVTASLSGHQASGAARGGAIAHLSSLRIVLPAGVGMFVAGTAAHKLVHWVFVRTQAAARGGGEVTRGSAHDDMAGRPPS